jgi:hypothetical protein
MPCIVMIGEHEYHTWIRYYRAPEGANKLPYRSVFFHGQFHNYDIKPYPVGETGHPRHWDRGINPGYKGIAPIGEPSWYETGQFPDDILTRPLPPIPASCCTPPAQLTGQIVVGGNFVSNVSLPALFTGGMVLGGDLIGSGGFPARLRGGLVLGGVFATNFDLPAKLAGGFVLGGTLRPQMSTGPAPGPYSGSGSGFFDEFGCMACPDGAASVYTFPLSGLSNGSCMDCGNLNGLVTLTYVGGCQWQSGQVVACGVASHYLLNIASGSVTVNLIGPAGLTWSRSITGWDCLSPLTLPRTDASGACTGVPSSITLTPEF